MALAPAESCPPSWREFLSLVENLLDQPDTYAQLDHIKSYIAARFGGQSDIWLAEPFYPLPDAPDLKTLQSDTPPELVMQAFRTRTAQCTSAQSCAQAAVPMITNDDLLGTILVRAEQGRQLGPDELEYLEGIAANAAMALQITRQISLKNFRSHQLDLVRQVSDKIANMTDIDLLSQQVTRLIQSTFNYYYVSIFTLQPGSDQLRFRASASDDPAHRQNLAFPVQLGEGIVGQVAQSGHEIIAPDIHKEPTFRYIDTLPETRSEAAVPLHSDRGVVGVLDVQSDDLNGFHEVDLLVLRSLAAQVALAIEGVQLLVDQQDKTSQLALLFEISHVITSILDYNELSEKIVSLIQKRLGYDFVEYFSYHPGRRKLFYEFGSGERSKLLADLDIAYDIDDPHGIIPWVARNQQRRVVNDVRQDPLYRPSEYAPDAARSELAMPIIYGGELQGVLDLQSEDLDAFGEEDLQILESLAASIAIAMRNAMLYRSEIWRSNVADRMRSITNLLSQNPDPPQIMALILQAIESSLPLDAAAIWLVDPNADSDPILPSDLKLGASYGVSEALLQEVKYTNPRVDDWMNLINGSRDASIREKGGLYGPLGLALNFDPDYSSVAAPMYAGGRPLGLLTIAHRTANRYGNEALSITRTYANYAAAAIENARLVQDAQQNAWMSRTLLKVSDVSRNATSISELLSSIAAITPELTGVERADFILWDEEFQQFQRKASSNASLAINEPVLAGADSPLNRLVTTNATVYFDEHDKPLDEPTETARGKARGLIVPLLLHADLVGAMLVRFVDTPQQKVYQDRLVTLVHGIANHTAVGLENLRLSEAQEQDAFINAALLQVAQAVVGQKTFEDILAAITHITPILAGVDRSIILLWQAEQQNFIVAEAHTGSHAEEQALKGREIPLGSFPLLDSVYDSGALHFCRMDTGRDFEAWQTLSTYSALDFTQAGLQRGDRLLLGLPLASHGDFYGVMLVDETYRSLSLLQKRLELLNGIALQTAMAVQNERLDRERVLQESREREMHLARQIQKTFLPSDLPQFPGWELGASWQTALQVGGDFYDVIPMGPDQLGLVIADVADKGMPAAMYMTVARTLIQAIAPSTTSPARLLQSVNRILYSEQADAMFVTAFFARVNLASGTIVYANAGHNPPLLISTSKEVQSVRGGGIALGVLNEVKYEDNQIELSAGDSLMLYTDGITETMTPDDELFGMPRFLELLRENAELPVKELLHVINERLIAFRQNQPPSDDVTILCIRRTGE